MAALIPHTVQNPNMCTGWQQQEAALDEHGGGAGGGRDEGAGGVALCSRSSVGKAILDPNRATTAAQSCPSDSAVPKLNSMALHSAAVSADVIISGGGGSGGGDGGVGGGGRKGGVVRKKQKVHKGCSGTIRGHLVAGGHAIPLISFGATNDAPQTNQFS